RDIYPRDDHDFYSRMFVSGLRGVLTLRGPGSKAARFAELLIAENEEFRLLWDEHEVGIRPREIKRYQHPEVGILELNCQVLMDPEQSHSLLVYTAVPGSESYEKLQLLSVIGAPTA
nr:transcriptional regulator [Streptomyces sp. DSM 41633]